MESVEEEESMEVGARLRSWRTAFLTLRDEIQALSSSALCSAPLLHLLNRVILSQSDNLIEAAPNLPSHEVTSDIVLLMELAQGVSDSEGSESLIQILIQLSRFDLCRAEPKLLITRLPTLLPCIDVLQLRFCLPFGLACRSGL